MWCFYRIRKKGLSNDRSIRVTEKHKVSKFVPFFDPFDNNKKPGRGGGIQTFTTPIYIGWSIFLCKISHGLDFRVRRSNVRHQLTHAIPSMTSALDDGSREKRCGRRGFQPLGCTAKHRTDVGLTRREIELQNAIVAPRVVVSQPFCSQPPAQLGRLSSKGAIFVCVLFRKNNFVFSPFELSLNIWKGRIRTGRTIVSRLWQKSWNIDRHLSSVYRVIRIVNTSSNE